MKSIKRWEVDDLEDTLIALLESFNYPVIRQGSLTDDEEYPQTFFTFWNNTTYGNSHYDNKTASVVYDFDVNVYSTDQDATYNLLNEAIELLEDSGFSIPDRGHDVASDESTHIGRGIQITKLK